ncbi:crotonase/enoyl-CoA hydratase family protein [Thioclava sp. A2]|uniref:crotonase/enoyl-CoA hydratase family protein n=1 Tax=Thioclava sp. FCG-A2 TaxID=3080562 RepID=UPI002954662C|nr:crotonase/enoyl-CoA hydratase family protein [Thioclava sp. A2]MDV7271538.1 crotonase/enoyl-CoA hydratase family protein [Thioclava sp. A2]
MDRVTVEWQGGVALVRLNRSDKMNAVDMEMIDAVIATAGELTKRPDLRAVVLTGAGEAFCAGLDVAMFSVLAGGDMEALIMPRTHGTANRFQQFSLAWRALPVPVIAALQGVAYGAGLQLAMGADMRIAAPGTRLSVMEMKWGLIPDMGGMVTLPELVRADVLRRLTYTAEPVLAAQAEQWGMVTEIADDPLARALELAQGIAMRSPSAIRAAKRLVSLAYTADEAAVLMAESREQTDLIGKPDQMEVIAANLQKRAPNFG